MQTNKIVEHYPMQKIAKIIGESGCYFLSLCYIAEKVLGVNVDPIFYYNWFTKQETNNLKWMDSDCYINYPALCLSYILRNEIAEKKINFVFSKVEIEKTKDTKYYPKKNEYLIGYFENEVVMVTYGHFVNLDSSCRVTNDPLGESNTVKQGILKSLRIVRIS